jgi:hypothetical protein
MGEGKMREILSIHPCGTSRVLLNAVKSYMGPSRFTSHPKEGVLRIFIALKNPWPAAPWPGFEPATFGSSSQHTNDYTTKATGLLFERLNYLL